MKARKTNLFHNWADVSLHLLLLKSYMACDQCDKIGQFLRVVRQIFFEKQPKCLATYEGYCEKWHFLSRAAVGTFKKTFGENWATFTPIYDHTAAVTHGTA